MKVINLIESNMFRIVFQPIYDYKRDVVIGYEALARGPEGTYLEDPKTLFYAAEYEGVRDSLELACFKKAFSDFRSKLSGLGILFFVNFHPDVLAAHCEEILRDLDGYREYTVIEVLESHSKIRYMSNYLKILRGNGVRIAFDDIGAGDRSLANLCEFRADFFKVDRSIIQGLMKVKSGDAGYYRALLKLFADFAARAGAEVIAEGVETKSQLLETLTSGVSLVQGYYFSKPKPADFWVKKETGVKQVGRC